MQLCCLISVMDAPTLELLPALIEPIDDMFPCDVMFLLASIADYDTTTRVDDIAHPGGENSGSPTCMPLLLLTDPSK